MKKLSLVLALVCFSLCMALAQRTISGSVVDESGEPLIGASILVQGTSTGTVTDIDGNFSLDLPENDAILIVSYTGFATAEVETGGQSVIEVVLSESAAQLNEIVVTGLGIRKEKKALGYAVSTIESDLVEQRVESDVSRILRGKAAGVDITTTSGLAGSGTNIIIRGYSSISGDNQPLFVVDGVPFNTSTNNDSNFQNGGATASSRFLDLDPNNIAEVSILKGLSATVLYGEAGRNGVVLVTTKTGSAGRNTNKKMNITVNQQVAFTDVANLPDYQDSFGNGFSGNFGWFFSNWGPAFENPDPAAFGSDFIGISDDGFALITHPYDPTDNPTGLEQFRGAPYEYRPYDNVTEFFEQGTVLSTSVGIDRNFDNGAALSANYSYQDDDGFIPENQYTRHNAAVGGRMVLDNGLSINASLNFTASERAAPPASVGFGSNPSGASVFANVVYTPRSIDLVNLPFQNPVTGEQVYYRRGSAIQNPLWGLNNMSDTEEVRRYFGNLTASYAFTDWLSATYRIGLDQFTQRNRRLINRGGSQVPDGQLRSTERLNTIVDQVLNIQASWQLGNDWDLDFLIGGNGRYTNLERNGINSTNQFVYGLLTQPNFIDHNPVFTDEVITENTLGVYSTATLGFRNWAYVNLQARNDWTSTLEEDNRSILYPSASISLIPTEAIASLANNRVLNYLKLRAGYGTSAGYPNPYQTRNFLGSATNTNVAPDGTVLNINTIQNRLGNANLEPELLTEIEFGLEGRFFDNRIGIDFSYYDKQSDDLIVDLDLDPASGFTNTTINAAEVSNKGVEIGLSITPFRGEFYWDINLNYTRNRNIVQSVAEGVDQVVIAGYTNLGNFAIPGEPFGTIQGTEFQRVNGELVVNQSTGEYTPGNDLVPIGDPNPNYLANWINTISYKGVSLGWQFSYTDGGDIYSITTATMLARGLTTDTEFDRFLPLILPGVDPEGNPNTVQAYAGDFFFNNYFFADEGAMFDATVIRLRELSLSYALPAKLLESTPFGSVSIRLVGENLWFNSPNFPEGVNFDPEVLSLGVGNGRGFDFVTAPTARKFGVNIGVTF